ncbi:MAG: DUF3667 domain-containing protein [Dokdonella sp.]|uniref:DUF3667 domain-containing protein n=1 Tax=Dokdonella sp. TaxID=2291710 RepID=UPI003F7F4748
MSEPCVNCSTPVPGRYCPTCGQKRFEPADRRFGHLLGEFTHSLTDLDGRVWRSLIALLFRPGLLSLDYNEGRRARWLSPVALFFAINVVYFLSPLHGDYAMQFDKQVSGRVAAAAAESGTDTSGYTWAGQAHAAFTAAWVDREASALDPGHDGDGYRKLRERYDARADDVSKALVILHLPFVALALLLIYADRRLYYAEHFVVAMHYFAFALVMVTALVHVYTLLQRHVPSFATAVPTSALDWAARFLYVLYAVLMLHRAYRTGWLRAVLSGAALIAAMVAVNLFVYRPVQFAATLWVATR